MRITYHVLSAPAPLGLLFIARTERGLRYLDFLDRKSIKSAIASHRDENPDAEWQASLLDLKPIVDQLEAYFCGALQTFDVPLDPVGSPFQIEVWDALCAIPYGETRSYGQIAKAVGQPGASRAVGLANNQNPLPIIVPCHRVIGSDGSLTGYGGGLPRKKWLLAHELHFGGLAGTTLDLFAGAMAAPPNRIASGEGPPLAAARAASPARALPAKAVPAERREAPKKSAALTLVPGGGKPAKPATKSAARAKPAMRAVPASGGRNGKPVAKTAPAARTPHAARKTATKSAPARTRRAPARAATKARPARRTPR